MRNLELDFTVQFQMRLDQENYTLPTIPAASLRLMDLLANPDCTNDAMEKTITLDPLLAGQVLKIANSCLYGSVVEINSLRAAILRIGRKAIRSVVLMNSIKATLIRNTIFLPAMQAIWKQSLNCAFFSKLLGKRLQEPGDELFLVGLLHNVGKLLVLSILHEMFQQTQAVINMEMLEKVYAAHHVEIGKKLLLVWKIPATVSEIIHWQSREEELLANITLAPRSKRMAVAILLSRKLCQMVEHNVIDAPQLLPLLDFLCISSQSIAEMVQQIHGVENEVAPFI